MQPKIYCFSNVVGGGEGPTLAVAEDGTILAEHYCSHEGWVIQDLGVDPRFRRDLHEHYTAHYPDGYELEFVPSEDIHTHEGLQRALKLQDATMVTEDFTLLAISIVDHEGQQHPVNANLWPSHGELESIPWTELLGRRITSVSCDDGRLVIGLSTKK